MERSHATPQASDVLLWTMIGDVILADVDHLFAQQMAFCQGKTAIYVIVDMTRMRQVDGEARRAAARAPKMDGQPMPVQAIAIVGGSFHLRMIGKMVNTAEALLNRRQMTPLDFFDTTHQARDWIESLKRAKDRGNSRQNERR
jgi:hypothetical protein